MALNQMGLGLTLTAKDASAGVIKGYTKNVNQARDASGKFVKGAGALAGGGGGGGGGGGLLGSISDGFKMAALGIAGFAGLKSVTDTASEFSFQIARIRTVTDEANFSTADLRKTTMGLASTYGADALQQADALYETISAGITDAGQATKLLDVANQFAIGGTTGLKGAVDVLTSAVNTYADSGLTAKQASDLMFTAINAGKTTADELSHSLGEVAPTAHAAGIGFGELQAAIAAMTVQGIKTPQAVTGLNALIANMIKPSADATKEAKRLGIAFDATALKTKGLKGVLDQLTHNTKVNNNTFGELFGSIDGIKAALSLTSGEGAKFDEILKMMDTSAGATDKAFATMSDTSKFQGERFKALLTNAKILIGEGLEPLRTAAFKTLNGLLEKFGALPAPVREMIVKAAALAASFLTVGGGVMMLISKLGGLSGIVELFSGGALAGLLAELAPLAAVIGTIVGLFAAFKAGMDGNTETASRFSSIFSGIKLAFQGLIQLFTQGGFSGAVRDEFLKGENPWLDFAIKVYLIVNRIENFLSSFGAAFEKFFASFNFGPFLDALGGIGAALGLTSNDAEESGAAFDAWGKAGDTVGTKVAQVFGILINVITGALQIVQGFIEAWNTIKPAVEELGASISAFLAPLGDLISSLGESSDGAGKANSSYKGVGSTIAGALTDALKLATKVIDSFKSQFESAIQAVKGGIDIVLGLLSGDWTRVWKGMKEVVVGALGEVIDLVFVGVQAIADMIDKIDFTGALKLGDKVRAMKAGLKETLSRNAFGDRNLGDAAGVDRTKPEERTGTQTTAENQADRDAAIKEKLANMAAYDAVVTAHNKGQTMFGGRHQLTPEMTQVAESAYTKAGGSREGGVDTAALVSQWSAALKSAPPPITNVTVLIDGEEVKKKVEASHASGSPSWTGVRE